MASTPSEFVPCPDPVLDHLWSPYPVNPTAAVAGAAGLGSGRSSPATLPCDPVTDR
jgi:hypothetical protein